MRLYIVRHADPDYPNNTITPQGHLEAEALSRRFEAEGLDRIYCSPMGRAIHTMEYSARACRVDPVIEEWTRELGDCHVNPDPWGRLAAFNIPGELVRGVDPLPSHTEWSHVPHLDDPKFEKLWSELKHFSDEFLARHGYVRSGGLYRCVAPNRERVAIFCHHGFGVTWIAHLLEIPLPIAWAAFWLAPTSVTTILMEQRSPEWASPRCVGLGDVGHLYAAGLPVQTSGFITENW